MPWENLSDPEDVSGYALPNEMQAPPLPFTGKEEFTPGPVGMESAVEGFASMQRQSEPQEELEQAPGIGKALRRFVEPFGTYRFAYDLLALPNTREVIDAELSLYNPVMSAFKAMHRRFTPEPGHDPMPLIAGAEDEEDLKEVVVGSASTAETQWRIEHWRREGQQRKTLEELPLDIALPLSLATGVLDPFGLIPFGGLAYKAATGTKRAYSVYKTAAKYAALGGASMAASEAVLHATQMRREMHESVAPIVAGIILPGVLGGASAKISNGMLKKLEGRIADELADEIIQGDPALRGISAGAAAVEEPGAGGMKGSGINWLVQNRAVNPMAYLQAVEADEARRVGSKMSDSGLKLKEHEEGVVTAGGDNPGTLETRIRTWDGPMATAHKETDQLYADYFHGGSVSGPAVRGRSRTASTVASLTGTRRGRLKPREFRQEVGKAMRENDTHAIPEVEQAAKLWRKKVFDPMYERAVKVGLLKKVDGVVGAPSYLTRMYKHDMVAAGKNARGQTFRDVLFQHFRGQNQQSNFSDAEILATVDEVIDNILGMPGRISPNVDIFSKAGPLKERVLNVPDKLIEDFLESDIEKVSRYYVSSLAPDIEIATKFPGDPNMEAAIAKVSGEYQQRINAAQTPKEKLALQDERDNVVRTITGIRDRMRGRYGLPENINGLPHRAFKIAQQVNVLRLMGMVTLASLTDIARPIMVHGLGPYFMDELIPILRNIGTGNIKAARAELREAGAVTEMVMHGRLKEMADLTEDWGRAGPVGRATEWMTDHFGMANLITPWTAFHKHGTGILAMNRILKAAKAVSEGRASRKQISNLASDFIDEDLARTMWREFSTSPDHGGIHRGLYLPNTEKWGNRRAKEALRNALVREVERTIVTPRSEKPLWTSKTWGALVNQFKGYMFSSTSKVLVAGLQQRDAAFVNGLLAMVALGGLTVSARMAASGRWEETERWTPTKWFVEAIDNSGVLGILGEIHNTIEKVSLGTLGASRFTGEQASRYASRGIVDSLVGPTFGLVEHGARTAQSFFKDEMTQSDLHRGRKLLPYNQLFYLRILFNQMEEGIGESLGLPKSRRVTVGDSR